jgi:hypothetical protein
MSKSRKTATEDSPINSALRQFEATEANLLKLERVWSKLVQQMPSGLQFGTDPTYDELVRTYEDILSALPKIDGWKPERVPMDLNAIGQNRLDAKEIGEISAEIAVEEDIEAPGRELSKYRHLLNKKRRQLIRSATLRANILETVLVPLINEQGEKEKGRDEFSRWCSFPRGFGWRGTERRRA